MVDQKDEIGFIFVVLFDISKTPNLAIDESMSLNKSLVAIVPAEDSQEKKRQLEEISIAKEELVKKEEEEKSMRQMMNAMAEQLDCGICYMTMH